MSEKGTDIPRDTSGGEAQMSFWDHLEVLRWALIRIAAVLVILVVVSFMAMPHIFDTLILGPASSDFFVYKWFASVGRLIPFVPDFSDDGFHVDIININVASQFMTHISTSFWLSLVLLFPYIVYELWKFVSPALYRSEKSAVGRAFFAGTFMFYLGCAVGYCLIFHFPFPRRVSGQPDHCEPDIPEFIHEQFPRHGLHHGRGLRTAFAGLAAFASRHPSQGIPSAIQASCRGRPAHSRRRHHSYRGSVLADAGFRAVVSSV